MTPGLRWIDPSTCEFCCGERILARYSATPTAPAAESPKPYLHPVSTLAGNLATAYRPSDHPWHHGIAWAFTYIDDATYWGGPTFQRESGTYVWQSNHGHQVHRAWLPPTGSPAQPSVVEQVDWLSPEGETVLEERRQISASIVAPDCWRLSFASEFLNPTDHPISMASPVCRGRPEGGYFGLMWRGAPSWAHGELLSAAPAISTVMGQNSPWIAYRQAPSEHSAGNTLLFVDHPSNPRHPTQWFARSLDQPQVSFSFAYSQAFILTSGGRLPLRYDIFLFDGRPERGRLATVAAEARQ